MYTKTVPRSGRAASRFSSRSGGGRRPFGHGSHTAFRGGRPQNKKRFKGSTIDERLFINKAKEDVPQETYAPTHSFNSFGLQEQIVANLTLKGYQIPSPIQDQAIPVVLQGRDIIGVANTGTGKTAAFLLPLINKILNDSKQKVLVLAPTRELANQIEKELRDFTRGLKIFSVACVGGMPIGKQIRELARGVHFIIGTPGRVKDLINRKCIVMANFQNIVLDEADRMLDMGFIDDMRFILKLTPAEKQVLFFSATFPPAIQSLCQAFLREPVTISVKTRDTASNVDQDVVRITDHSKKIDALHDLLLQPECSKVLIFREMKRHVDELGRDLRSRGFKALALHGDMRNRAREHAVKSLACGNVQIVIATDVAARGIDIPDITHVINYDVPQDYETYIHRVGRTGRGSAKGKALTFI